MENQGAQPKCPNLGENPEDGHRGRKTIRFLDLWIALQGINPWLTFYNINIRLYKKTYFNLEPFPILAVD